MKKFWDNFKNRAVKAKLSFMTRVSIICMLILGAGALFGAYEIEAQTKDLHDNWMNANNIIAELDYLTSSVRLQQYAHIISDKRVEFEVHEAEIARLLEEIDMLMAEYELTISSETERQYYEAASVAWANYLEVTGEEFFKLSRAMKTEEANKIMLGEGYDAFTEFQTNFDTLLEFNHAGAEESYRYGTSVFIFVCILVVVLVVIAVVLTLRIAKVIIEGIVTPVDQLKYAAAEMTYRRP